MCIKSEKERKLTISMCVERERKSVVSLVCVYKVRMRKKVNSVEGVRNTVN